MVLLVSLPGLTGQSSTHDQCLLDRPLKPGDDGIVGGKRVEEGAEVSLLPQGVYPYDLQAP
jgi:hypothetical protein